MRIGTDENTHVLREFERFVGTRLSILEGRGTEENPYRTVTYYFDEHAHEIAREDPAEAAK